MNSFETVLSIILMVLLGYITKTLGVLSEEDAYSLNRVVVNIAIPSLIFNAIYNSKISTITALLKMPFVSVMVSLLIGVMVFSWTRIAYYNKRRAWSIILPAAMVNSGFMGYPVVLGVFGDAGLLRAILYDMGSVFVFLAMGVLLSFIFGNDYRRILRRTLFFPPLWALFLGVAFNALSLPLGLISHIIDYLSRAAVPLIMISLGLSLDFKVIRSSLKDAAIVSTFRLLISPFLAALIVTLFLFSGLEKSVAIIEAAMPSAMLSMVLSIENDLDISLTAACVFMSTTLSLISLPLIIGLIG
ncbi:MAG: AEC family transporter [Methanothermobacter sp.]|jgi:auxin efflux carrier (AEC)|uniref:AEC family transporter n=1 Tax=Methanothermobacter tenebrarum TaxID=680118 RepID=UPI0017F99AC2|nr:AEC family transporter [Methanothermobacter tenebrarum]MDD3454075.1 AEC family transporter [Methanobacteriales archaeon]MDI6882687.1 AEC family transporter [Methanothermobacter sp.]MDX9693688.1 AEC family transporter [Methanothermobacter sp.]HHW04388.1 transporter [Methanothermobacter sp.]HOQ19697.1 AEC family transporter [Methanothermobacter sp.]